MNIELNELDHFLNDSGDMFMAVLKTIVKPYFERKGFRKYKTVSFAHINEFKCIEIVEFQRDNRYGQQEFTVNVIISPLYTHAIIPYVVYTRLPKFEGIMNKWWSYSEINLFKEAMREIIVWIEKHVLGFFEEYKMLYYSRDCKKYKSWLKQNGTTASPWDEIYYCVICNCLTSKKLETIRDSMNFEKYRSQIVEGEQKVDYDTLVEIVKTLDVERMSSMIGINFEFQCTIDRIPKMLIKNAASMNPELFTTD